MKRAGRKAGGGSRALTPDETELWRHATRTLDKVKGKQRIVAQPRRDENALSEQADRPARGEVLSAPRRELGLPSVHPPGPPAPRKVGPPPMADFDRRQARRIAAGKAEVEARIDLHGLRQGDAHARLRAFLFDAHARGLKTVLVITGKGGGERSSDASRALADDRQRGVLRRSVPLWLREADIQRIVVSFTAAGVRHGGTGALYVRLRRKDRSG